MLGSEAVTRVNDALGWRPSGHALEPKIVARFAEAQRELEMGKTLPKFLLQEDQTLSLLQNASTVALPAGFLRESDESLIRYSVTGTAQPVFIVRRIYIDAIEGNISTDNAPTSPKVYVVRNQTLNFITRADKNYTLTWDYYKAADAFSTSAENAWLKNAPEWLIGECGKRIAMDLRDADGFSLFDKLATVARGAVFGEILADETASGPLRMGANL